jgi:hypothetical protein
MQGRRRRRKRNYWIEERDGEETRFVMRFIISSLQEECTVTVSEESPLAGIIMCILVIGPLDLIRY